MPNYFGTVAFFEKVQYICIMRLPETNRNNMRLLIAPIICILLFWCCSNNPSPNVVADEQHNAKFDSFLAQFAQFDSKQLSEAFFSMRKQFPNEKWCPCIDKILFSSYLPFDEPSKGETGFCYRPCYKIDEGNYYILAIKQEQYSYEENTLLTYDKKGKIIDFETIGVNDCGKRYKIEPPTGEREIVYTQYCFKDVESAYDGDCDVSVYKVTIAADGRINKSLLREDKNVKVTLSFY